MRRRAQVTRRRGACNSSICRAKPEVSSGRSGPCGRPVRIFAVRTAPGDRSSYRHIAVGSPTTAVGYPATAVGGPQTVSVCLRPSTCIWCLTDTGGFFFVGALGGRPRRNAAHGLLASVTPQGQWCWWWWTLRRCRLGTSGFGFLVRASSRSSPVGCHASAPRLPRGVACALPSSSDVMVRSSPAAYPEAWPLACAGSVLHRRALMPGTRCGVGGGGAALARLRFRFFAGHGKNNARRWTALAFDPASPKHLLTGAVWRCPVVRRLTCEEVWHEARAFRC